jgi:hypothetical protein
LKESKLIKKAKNFTKFLDSKDFLIHEGIITGLGSNFIYLSNVRTLKKLETRKLPIISTFLKQNFDFLYNM